MSDTRNALEYAEQTLRRVLPSEFRLMERDGQAVHPVPNKDQYELTAYLYSYGRFGIDGEKAMEQGEEMRRQVDAEARGLLSDMASHFDDLADQLRTAAQVV